MGCNREHGTKKQTLEHVSCECAGATHAHKCAYKALLRRRTVMTQKIDAVDTFTETRTQRLETSSGGLGNIKGFYHLKKNNTTM